MRLRALQKEVVYIRCYGTVEVLAYSSRGCRQTGEADEFFDTGLSGASLFDRLLVRGMGDLEFAGASEEGLRGLHYRRYWEDARSLGEGAEEVQESAAASLETEAIDFELALLREQEVVEDKAAITRLEVRDDRLGTGGLIPPVAESVEFGGARGYRVGSYLCGTVNKGERATGPRKGTHPRSLETSQRRLPPCAFFAAGIPQEFKCQYSR